MMIVGEEYSQGGESTTTPSRSTDEDNETTKRPSDLSTVLNKPRISVPSVLQWYL